jgi:hypothetical protein
MNFSGGRRRVWPAILIILVIYGAVGFFALPPIIRVQAEKRLTAELGRRVSIGKVRLNPFALSLALEDFGIQEKDGAQSFLSWKRLYVRFDAIRSIGGDWVLGAVNLDGFHARAVVNRDGTFNFSDLIARFASGPAAAHARAGRAVRVANLRVDAARLDYSDLSLGHPFTTVVGPLTFAVSDFRTAGSRGAPYNFEAETESGERLSWSGTLSADPVASRGEFSLGGIVLRKYMPYIEGSVQALLEDGTLSASGRYDVDFDAKSRSMRLDDAQVNIRGLAVAELPSKYPLIELKQLDVTGIQVDALAAKASFRRIYLADGNLTVRREKNGSINLLDVLSPGTPRPRSASHAPLPALAPQINAAEISVNDFKVDIADEALAHPPLISLSNLNFSMKDFSFPGGAAMPLHLSFSWAPNGTVNIDGTVTLKPELGTDLKAQVANLEILPLSPYFEQLVNARITEGTLNSSAWIRVAAAGGSPNVEIRGDAILEKIAVVDGVEKKELLGASRIAATGIDVSTTPALTATVARVEVVGPYARVRVNADKSLNILSLVAHAGASASAPTEPPPKISVGVVVISAGDFSFLDQSVEPNVRLSVTDFGGTVSGLSSENIARADVGLGGMVGGAGPVRISGKLDLLGARRFVGLTVAVGNMDLLPLSPYSGKFAGYELARGQLVFDSRINVDGDRVDLTNVVTLNQFTFGSATASPDATKLPVRLGVALLKDVDGRIIIDLPVQGSLADPEFRIGRVVLRVIVNLLTKAAVSPFSLIGSMFGGGGEELAFQEFAPGTSDLQMAEEPKLETLAKAMANRPGLSLGIAGGYDEAADTYALKRLDLADLVRRSIWEERHAANPNIPPPGQLSISPGENAAMVKKLFDSRYPPGTRFGTPLPAAPRITAPPPEPPNLFRRIVDIVTLKRRREEDSARKEDEGLAARHEMDVKAVVEVGTPLEEMTGRLAESMVVTSDDLNALAAARAERVRNRLMASGHIAADRLFLSKGAQGPRVLLTLQ